MMFIYSSYLVNHREQIYNNASDIHSVINNASDIQCNTITANLGFGTENGFIYPNKHDSRLRFEIIYCHKCISTTTLTKSQ